ncbi:MAG: hypothetical protein CVU39_23075 [Chloroflexi bacterium HGW-Chloroflexi-10]|nr:MAG: hypothetical protein CVU39_23075 [Chloroflexi bacterium HGW-Chloroflexi-10]
MMRTIFHFALADVKERSRRYSFFVTMMLVIFLGYIIYNGDMLITLGDYRGVYNSAWVGSLMSLTITFFVGLIGFYLVKNSVERDIQTGVGQIIATTPTSRLTYVLGKWFSHLTLFTIMIVILGIAAILMQLVYREVPEMDVWALLAPLVFVAFPCMALIAGLTIFFESVPWLRGGLGNVIYFFLFMFSVPMAIEWFEDIGWINDPLGIQLFMQSMSKSASQAFPTYSGGFSFSNADPQYPVLGTFLWPGIDWTLDLILHRMIWIVLGLGFVLLAALVFNRFDTAGVRRERKPKKTLVQTPEAKAASRSLDIHPLNRLTHRTSRFSFLRVYWSELLLLLKGYPWWFYAGVGGVMIASAASPLETSQKIILPILFIVPILIWSGMGGREKQYGTQQLIFNAPQLLSRQWPAAYLAGVSVTAVLCSGLLFSLLLHQQAAQVSAILAAVLFIPALALACGVWSGTPRLFEVLYALWWYMGPLQGLPTLDFGGTYSAPQYTYVYWLFSLGLLLAAFAGRWWQMHRL